MSTFRQNLEANARFSNRNMNAPGYVNARAAYGAPAQRFPFHIVGAALVIVGAVAFAAFAAHGAAHIVAPLNAALSSAR